MWARARRTCELRWGREGKVGVPWCEFVTWCARAGVVVVWHDGECPAGEDVFAVNCQRRRMSEIAGWEGEGRWMAHVRDGGVAFGVLHTCGVPVGYDMTIDVFHQEIGGEDAVYEVVTDVMIIKVVLK